MEIKNERYKRNLIINTRSINYRKYIFSLNILLIFSIQCVLNKDEKYQYRFYINENQIKLVIKEAGTFSVIYSSFSNKPNKIEYDNLERSFSNSSIFLNSNINIVLLKFSSAITTCNSMFKRCSQISEIDLTDFDSSQVLNIDYMFDGCNSLTSVKFGNFNTSRLDIMEYVFQNCNSLETIDLSSFDTSKVTDFHYMFAGCSSLKSIDLSNFNGSSCICTYHMFNGCTALTSINFSGFDTSKVTYMYNMFYNCNQLTSLDLSTFNLKSLIQMQEMFYGCTTLKYINIKSYFQFSKSLSVTSNDILTSTSTDLVFCVNDLKTLNSFSDKKDNRCSGCIIQKADIFTWLNNEIINCCYISCEECEIQGNDSYHNCIKCSLDYPKEIYMNNTKNCYKRCDNYFYIKQNQLFCLDNSECPNDYNKLIFERKECVKNCSTYEQYFYQHKNICYSHCPNGTEESNIMPYYCVSACTKELPFKLIQTDECAQCCPIRDIQINNCELNYKENNSNLEDKILYCIKQDLTKGYNCTDVDMGNDVVIERNMSTYIITKTGNQKKGTNITTVNFGSCEESLKNYYGIPLEENLYLLRIEAKIKGMKIPKIEYEIYYPINGTNLTKLDLSVCQNDKIEISIPVELKGNIDMYNPQSDYYNDICYTFTSDSGTDISLSDRREEFINNNMTLYDEDCTFVRYDFVNNRSICSCEIKIKLPLMSEITVDKNKLYDSFTDFKNIANIHILKCYKLLFSKEGISKNIGFYILIPIMLLLIICIIIFFVYDYKKLKKKIEFLVYAKKNFKKLELIYEKSHNKKKKTKDNKKEEIEFNSRNNGEKRNSNLISLNKKKSKKK